MRFSRTLLAAAVGAALVISARAGEEKTDLPAYGNEKLLLKKADPTISGSFEGTWLYVNRDSRYAMWARTKDGVPQVKIQFQSLANPESFESDWDGKALYYIAGTPVTFEFKVTEADANQIKGDWSWLLTLDETVRNETANVVMHRTGDGRTLLMDFQNYQKLLKKRGQEKSVRVPVAWTWTKISKRELLWDELPF